MNDLLEELRECTTCRKEWWGITVDGYLYGEVVSREDGDAGFNLSLFETPADAKAYMERVYEDDEPRIPYEIVAVDLEKAVLGKAVM